MYAVDNGRMDAARVLISGADVDAADLDGRTVLMGASYFGMLAPYPY